MGGKKKYSAASYRLERRRVRQFTLRISHEEAEELVEVACRSGRSINQTILTFITWGIETERAG